MDICISHLYNRQIKKSILQDVFYKLENYDNEGFLCFDINSSGNLLVASSKTSLYFFHILTGTLLVQYCYSNEQEKYKHLKKDVFEEVNINSFDLNGINNGYSQYSNKIGDDKNEGNFSGNQNGMNHNDIEYDQKDGNDNNNEDANSGENTNNDEHVNYDENDNNEEEVNNNEDANNDGHWDENKYAQYKQSKNCVEDLKNKNEYDKNCATANMTDNLQNEYSEKLFTGNISPFNNDFERRNNKRKQFSLKGQKMKKVKKRSRHPQKSLNKNQDNTNCSKSKNNDCSNKKNSEEKLEDENIYIKKVQFIKNDEYLLCISKRYLHIYKICKYPITRIVYIDLLYLCIGIETIISDKLFFPCFFSEYFYFLYKTNEYKRSERVINNALNNYAIHSVTPNSDIDMTKCKEKSDYFDMGKEVDITHLCIGDAAGERGHLHILKKFYKLYESLNFKKIRNFEMCEVKCISLKKKNYIDNDEKKTVYIIDLILCLKEQIPYVSRIYIEQIGEHINELNKEYMNDYIVDINQTFPLISVEHMNITFQESARERCAHVKKDTVYTKSKTKIKKKYLKGFLKNLVNNQGRCVNQKERKYMISGVGNVETIEDNIKILNTTDGHINQSSCLLSIHSDNVDEKDSSCNEAKDKDENIGERKNEEISDLTKYYENYEKNRKYLKKIVNGFFPICFYKKGCKRRFKELPTALNIYDNLDNLLRENAEKKICILEGEEKLEGKEEKQKDVAEEQKIVYRRGHFKKENNHYIFDYSGKDKNNYFKFPCDLLRNKNTLKNVNKYRNVDKNSHYVFVGTYSYILAFELHYIKEGAIIEENESSKMNLFTNNIACEKIKIIKDEVYKVYNNFFRTVKTKKLFEKKIELKFLFKIYLGIVAPLEIVIREKGNILCVRTQEKVFLYKINYKYSVENSLINENERGNSSKGVPISADTNSTSNKMGDNSSLIESEKKENEKEKTFIYSRIDQICLYHTIHNPIQKEIHELCCFSEDIYHSSLLVVSLKSGIYTLYIYDLKMMDLQNAVKVNISAHKGFKQIKWVKCYDMLVALSNVGNYILILKNKHLNNWSFFISDFELIDSNIEVIEEDNEFDFIENIQPKHKNIDDDIWKYFIIYLNIFVKNKICIQNLKHPSCLFPMLYTGYYKNCPKYFFYDSNYDFSKENFLNFNLDASVEKKWEDTGKNGKKKSNKFLQIRENLFHYTNLKFEEKDETQENDLFIVDNSNTVHLFTSSPIYYLYYKNIINFSI
ncbi:conserved Plasmodium protein, unknown function [Plasmodium malariae]|uniref:Uncharacterized protein n=1 Tax=Plasmodium malariae TaxID=5858 RepID=A0A1A8VNL6_PLAMA|nr:conserved Plasmodium protein, unknown function [Plasmodium malariae]SBS81247.1 hypothetical protein, conserved [Plasmodium malariae]SBT86858.1 conserved Plasmodium protein, unknown function [Plasmodium malariae]